jgi:primosomal protein N' (replication factor Y)
MDTLFPGTETQSPPADPPHAPSHRGPFAAVAIEDSLDKLLDYSVPAKLQALIRVGQRVKVPLGRGNRPAHGYVIDVHPTTAYPKIKPLLDIEDERVLLSPKMMELARWMSRYYCAPLGAAIDTMIPSAVKKQVGLGYAHMVRPAKSREELQAILEKTRAVKRRSILARLLQLEPDHAIELNRLAGEAGSTPQTVRKLSRLGWITITPEIDLPSFTSDLPITGGEQETVLNEDQQKVFDDLAPRVRDGGFSVNLLLGVTGSGKTEVYLQCIREVVSRGKQAIIMVPEIALTPQTVRRFTARFPRVAILHSGLSNTDRHRYWQQISLGKADVVVGARSAVFAPVPNLGMIVVDEEHEASYKQDSAPRYHGRDVAVMRARMEGVPVLLGSATPSLETYQRVIDAAGGVVVPHVGPALADGTQLRRGTIPSAKADPTPAPRSENPYHVLVLPKRVRGLSMPHVELIDMVTERRMRKGIHLFSQRLEASLKNTILAGQQAIILLNRRGYSNFVFCSSCQNPVHCKYCDTTMTYHRTVASGAHSSTTDASLHTGQLHCHYCLAVTPLPETCPECGKKLSLFGLGTQRVEEELARKFPDLKYARVDSDSMHGSKDYEELLARFGRGEIQVMLGTQMIAKGLDYPNVTLVGVISGDTALALPDFRAAERTFQLITQVAGRAGRGEKPGRVILQTFLPEDLTIQAALRQDFLGFAKTELGHRKETGLPPYGRMVRIVMRDQDLDKLHRYTEELALQIADAIAMQGNHVKLKGPMPCAISRIAGYHRQQIVLNAPRADSLQRLLAAVREEGHLAKSERIAVDVDPVSLL